MELSFSIPTDSSGFLRRECPACEREFKWFAGDTEQRPPDFLDPENYHCPYCGTPADTNSWWTPAQLEYAEALSVGPISRQLASELRRDFGKSVKFTPANNEVPDTLVDPDDMIMIEPPCHPFEPLKVSEEWSDPLHCLVCGSRFRI